MSDPIPTPPVMRAKLRVNTVTVYDTCDVVNMTAVCKDGGYDETGSDENNTFARFSPSAAFDITIANPALFGQLRPNQEYYVDFTAVPVVGKAIVEP